MNRRTFLQASAASPLAILSFPARTLRVQFSIDDSIMAQMIIAAHSSAPLAEFWRSEWEERAFEGEGEWYLQTSQRRELPDYLTSLPGTLMYHTFVIGYAAEERSMLVAALRRDYVACVIRMSGDQQDEMIALATWFADQPLPERWELLWNSAQLNGFVPTTEEYGATITPNDAFWP